MMKRVVYPLFFLVLALIVIIPSSTPLAHASTPVYDRSTKVDQCVATCSASSLASNAGDTIMISDICYNSAGTATGTPTDSISTNYKVVVQNNNQANAGNRAIYTGTSSGGSFQVTVPKGNCTTFSFSVDVYSFVTGIGVTNNDVAPGGAVSGAGGVFSDTLTMIIQPNSFIYELFDPSSSQQPCPSPTSGSNGQTTRDTWNCFVLGGLQDGISIMMDKQYSNGGSTPSTATGTFSSLQANVAVGWFHFTVELLASGGSVTQVSNCYGNCGSPAITSANTNSTKAINFNITQTYFYENQIIFPALILNMSARVACTYGTAQCPFAETLTLGFYATQTNCFNGVPFTPTCPAQLVASAQVVSPAKGLFTFNVNFGVFTGQWIALGFTGSRSGLQLNDTNTAINIFNTSGFPATLSNTASQGTSKAEVYAWAIGNTIIGGGIIPSSSLCSQAVDFICTMNLAACGLTPSNCLVGALVLGLMWTIFSIAFLEVALFKAGMTMGLPGGIYVLIFVSWMTAWTIAVGNLWFPILEILVVVYLFTSNVVGLASGTHKGGATA